MGRGLGRDTPNKTYKDTGCEWWPSCLDCPFLQCKDDTKDEVKRAKRVRNEQIREKYKAGAKQKDLVKEFNLYQQMISRIVRK